MKRDVLPLEDILRDPEKFSWGAFVYAAINDDISITTETVVIPDFDPDLEEESVSVDGYEHLAFKDFLSVDDTLKIKENLRMRNKSSDVNAMLIAVKYYYENDAFIELLR